MIKSLLSKNVVILFISVFVFGNSIKLPGQIHQKLVTNTSSKWAITKNSQAIEANPIFPAENWMTDLNPGLLDAGWTYDLAIANIAPIQTGVINNVGNGAQPIWIVQDVCNYTDDYTKSVAYHLRNTFEIDTICRKVKQVVLRYAADNLCRIYLNGSQIISMNGLYDYGGYMGSCTEVCGVSGSYQIVNLPQNSTNSLNFYDIETVDLLPLLKAGTNVIAIEIINVGGCGINYAWFCGNIDIEYQVDTIALHAEQITQATCLHQGSFEIQAQGGTAPYTYQLVNGPTQNSGKFNVDNPGQYQVIVSDAGGCQSAITVTISGNTVAPEFTIVSMDNYIDCIDPNTFLRLGPSDSDLTFSIDDEPYTDSTYFTGLSAGTHIIRARDSFGCEAKPIQIEVFENLAYALQFDEKEICRGDSLVFFGKVLKESGIFKDTSLSVSLCDTIFQLDLTVSDRYEAYSQYRLCRGDSVSVGHVKYTQPGEYFQILQNPNGCDSTLHILIELEDEAICQRDQCRCYIPNVFTPNHDGINDEFKVESHNATITYMAIYNRWGAVVYSSNEINPSWDGYFAEKEASPGVYVYIIKGVCEDLSPFFRYGDVTLLK